MGPVYTLVSRAGEDTLHVEHPWEACNVDDAEHVEQVDDLTAAALLERGAAVACEHCRPTEAPTLNTRGDAP